jgi:hypothetical protein
MYALYGPKIGVQLVTPDILRVVDLDEDGHTELDLAEMFFIVPTGALWWRRFAVARNTKGVKKDIEYFVKGIPTLAKAREVLASCEFLPIHCEEYEQGGLENVLVHLT